MNPKVSIIVPVYNVSKFIEKCARSLFNQTFKDVEFIFVDDATPDDSISKLKAIIQNFEKNNLFFDIKILVHLSNLGLASARITALKEAKGDYVLMVDGDDYIEHDMVDTMYSEAQDTSADIVVCDMLLEFKNKTIYFNDYLSPKTDDHFKDMIMNQKVSPSLCNKLIKKTLFQHPGLIYNTNLEYMEDRYLTVQLYFFATKIVKVNNAFYHYVKQNSNSINYNYNRLHFKSLILFWEIIDKFLALNNLSQKYSEVVAQTKIKDKLNLMFYTDSKYLRKQFRHIFNENELKSNISLKFGQKLMLLLIRYKLFILTSVLRSLIQFKTKLFRSK